PPRHSRLPAQGRGVRARRADRARRGQRAAASTTARNARASLLARMTATPFAPAAMQSRALDASMPPIATTGALTASQIAASPSRPIGEPASGLVGGAHTGPAPMDVP